MEMGQGQDWWREGRGVFPYQSGIGMGIQEDKVPCWAGLEVGGRIKLLDCPEMEKQMRRRGESIVAGDSKYSKAPRPF